MEEKLLSLGIDTSNYKTSVAVTSSEGEIIFNSQSFLKVKEGQRGLRQSEALFQQKESEGISEWLLFPQDRDLSAAHICLFL